MLEVLVSLTLFALLLLGFDAMQVLSLQAAQANYYFFNASAAAQAMVEKISVKHGMMTIAEEKIWQQQLQQALPQGRGDIQFNDQQVLVTIFGARLPLLTVEKIK